MFGGTLLHSLDHVVIEGLPTEMPSQVEVDVGPLETLGAAIHVKDIAVPAGLTVLTDAEVLVATVAAPRVAEEVEVEEEEAPAASKRKRKGRKRNPRPMFEKAVGEGSSPPQLIPGLGQGDGGR